MMNASRALIFVPKFSNKVMFVAFSSYKILYLSCALDCTTDTGNVSLRYLFCVYYVYCLFGVGPFSLLVSYACFNTTWDNTCAV